MSGGDSLGEFEHLLLLAVIRLGDGTYGVPVRDELASRAGRDVTLGAVYSTVRRLEAKGLLETWMSEPDPVPGGRARKRIRMTPAGLDAVRRARARLDRMAEGLDAILGS